MKTIVINECEGFSIPDVFTFDLNQGQVKDCTGCWTCWWKTPGRCIYKDLNEFYHQYITADKVVFFASVSKGFVSGKIKTLFDRMIPLYLPYTSYKTGESMHVPRYEKYPDIEFYYQGKFETPTGREIFEDYIHRVFYQFHSSNISVKPIEDYMEKNIRENTEEKTENKIDTAEDIINQRESTLKDKQQSNLDKNTNRSNTKSEARNKTINKSIHKNTNMTIDNSMDKSMNTIILNGSPKGNSNKSNSQIFANHFVKNMDEPCEIRCIADEDYKGLAEYVRKFDTVIMILPLYIHAMPGIVMKFIEELNAVDIERKNIGFIVQAGFIETAQHKYLHRYFENLAGQLNYNYLGTVSKGEAAGIYMYPRMFKKVLRRITDLGRAYQKTGTFDTEIVEKLSSPYELSKFKVWLLELVNKVGLGNIGWHKVLRDNNALDKRLDKPFSR
ncbi:MAG: hypothetical protein ACOC2J_05125 [bacterium]